MVKSLPSFATLLTTSDNGGMVPGSMAGGMSEIYQEGLRIPVVRLFKKGEIQQDIMDIMLLNVRVPEERQGDHNAQIASCRLGERRFKEVVKVHGLKNVLTSFDEIISRTHQRMKDTIAQIPDGIYEFKDYMDSDGLDTFDIPICLKLTVDGERIHLDFAGTSQQVKGNINTTLNAVQASVNYALIGALDSEMPSNQGVLDAVEIACEPGTILNCLFPAPVAARAHACQRVIDIVLGALSKAIPDKVIAAANAAGLTMIFLGSPKTNKPYLYFETIGGGMGARATKDGKDGVQVGITNTSNLPVESIEQEYPLRVEEYGFVENSGGAGQFRGGLGLRRVLTPVDHECVFNGAGERFRYKPWGLFGGEAGASGQFMIEDSDGNRRLDDKPNEVEVKLGTKITVETPGAGGYGNPEGRDAKNMDQDLTSGKYSLEFMRQISLKTMAREANNHARIFYGSTQETFNDPRCNGPGRETWI